MATLTWHGHSCFLVETDGGQRIMIDPWIDENPASDIKVKDIDALDYILVSHGHSDHFDDCIPLAKKTGATVISTYELVAFVQSQGAADALMREAEAAGKVGPHVQLVTVSGRNHGARIIRGAEVRASVNSRSSER